MVWQGRVQKAARRVGRLPAGGVFQNEKQFCARGILKHRFEVEFFALQSEFREAGNGL